MGKSTSVESSGSAGFGDSTLGEGKRNTVVVLAGMLDGGKKRVAVLVYDRHDEQDEPLRCKGLEIGPWFRVEDELDKMICHAVMTRDDVVLFEETSEAVGCAVGEAVEPDKTLACECEKRERKAVPGVLVV